MKNKYGNMTTPIQILKEMANIVQKPEESIYTYANRFELTLSKLRSFGNNISAAYDNPMSQKEAFMSGMCNQVAASGLRYMKDNDRYTYEDLRNESIRDDKQANQQSKDHAHRSSAKPIIPTEMMSDVSANMNNTQGVKTSYSKDNQYPYQDREHSHNMNMQCTFCDKRGHWSNNCWFNPQNEKPRYDMYRTCV